MKRSALSIYTALTTVVIGLILLATGGLGWTSYYSTRTSLEESWMRRSEAVAERAGQEAATFLTHARPATALARSQSDRVLDFEDTEALARYALDTLLSYEHLNWMAWADERGRYIAAFRTSKGALGVTIRTQSPEGTVWREFDVDPDGQWGPERRRDQHYDPRERPFWRQAQGEPAWLPPYIFMSWQQAGVTWVEPTQVSGGLRGTWQADFECGPLSAFLATLEVGETGRVYLLDTSGRVVAHPEGKVSQDGEILLASEHPDPLLRRAWAGLQVHEARTFLSDGILISSTSLEESTGVPWTVVTALPEAELYGVARGQARTSILLTLAMAVVSMGAGLLFTRHLSGAVREVEQQMEGIARLELNEVRLGGGRSPIREINDLGQAHDRMKRGLRSFGRYVPRQLVAQLLRTGSEAQVGGEERELTVIFSDIAGFTSLVEATEPETMLQALTAYLTEMDEAITGQGGSVIEYLGDAIVAVFNAPGALPDHPLQACRAALAMQAQIEALLALAPERGHPPLPTRIGVCTGRALVGNIGAAERFNYTVLGQAVSHAEWLEQRSKAEGTTVLISERTARAVAHAMALREVGTFQVDGETMAVFELLGELRETQ